VNKPSSTLIAVCALPLLLVAAAAAAQTTGLTIRHFEGGAELYSLDLATADLTPIGPLGLPGGQVEALAFLPSGALVAVEGAAGELHGVDPATGEATLIGGLGIGPVDVGDLTADACGRLWMVTEAPPEGGGTSELYTIDPATGAAELRGVLPSPVHGLAAAGEAVFTVLENHFVEAPRIVRLDPETLALTDVGALDDFSGLLTLTLDFDDEGALVDLGVIIVPITAPPFPIIIRSDLGGGIVSTVSHPIILTTLAASPPPGFCGVPPPQAIPAVSAGGMAALAILLAAGGAILVGRRA